MLLAGLGDTTHVFDDVAPTLATRHRVIAISRRGHPGSSSPMTGYTLPRLADDIARVMDAVGLKTAVIVGHSFAGEEMHVLAARHARRVRQRRRRILRSTTPESVRLVWSYEFPPRW